MAAIPAAQAQEAVRQDAALQEGVGLFLDELLQFTSGAGLSVRDVAGRVLLHQAVQLGFLGPVAIVVHQAHSGRAALWLAWPRGGVHGKDMAQGRVCTVSILRAYRHRPSVSGTAEVTGREGEPLAMLPMTLEIGGQTVGGKVATVRAWGNQSRRHRSKRSPLQHACSLRCTQRK